MTKTKPDSILDRQKKLIKSLQFDKPNQKIFWSEDNEAIRKLAGL